MKPVDATYFPPIPLSSDRNRPLYRQIHGWFRNAILGGQLRPGQVVPSSRKLAAHLRISREPVLVAFELLHAEGYLESRIGGKTRVAAGLPERTGKPTANHAHESTAQTAPRTVRGHLISPIWNPDDPWWKLTGAFRIGIPDVRHFPTATWSSLIGRHARNPIPQSAGSMGLPALRAAIAEYLRTARDVHCRPEQIMIVSGTQHGLHLAGRVLLGAGDSVWLENPGYWGARGAMECVGASLVPVPVDDEGMDIAEAIRLKPGARMACVTPAHQFPMGSTMSVSRRLMLLDWAAHNDAWILEDDYDGEFRFSGQPIPSLQSLDAAGRVIYIGTFSKALSAGLRLGYMVIPEDLVSIFRTARQAIDFAAPNLCQQALADFMHGGHFSRHIHRLNRLYSDRRKAFIKVLREQVGSDLEVVGTVAGLHLVGMLPHGVDDEAVARRLAMSGVSSVPLSTCWLGRPARPGLILGYASAEVDAIRKATKTLAGVLRHAACEARTANATARPSVPPDEHARSASTRPSS